MELWDLWFIDGLGVRQVDNDPIDWKASRQGINDYWNYL